MATALGGTFGLRKLEPADVVIFIKEPPSPSVLELARKVCHYVVYDPVDNYRFDSVRGLEFDAVIACNSTHLEKLSSVISCNFFRIIPHHHCMIGKTASFCDHGTSAGYVGDDENLGVDRDLFSKAFGSFVNGRELSILGKIGIGIAYRPNGEARLYKSGVKLANYWAHCAAAICSPDKSYLEMGKDGEDMLVAESVDDVFRLTRRLMDDNSLRIRLVKAGVKKANNYSIEAIKLKYLELIEGLECRSREGKKHE
jgi:hypothetical protein